METRSFYAKYHARSGVLIGGITKGQSSRFQYRSDARTRLEQTVEINSRSGANCEGEVVESDLPPEILRHCHPTISQAIGGKCFRCGKILTIDDAKEAKAVFD